PFMQPPPVADPHPPPAHLPAPAAHPAHPAQEQASFPSHTSSPILPSTHNHWSTKPHQTHKKPTETLDIPGNGGKAGYGDRAVCEGGVRDATPPTAGIGFRDPPEARNWTAPRSY